LKHRNEHPGSIQQTEPLHSAVKANAFEEKKMNIRSTVRRIILTIAILLLLAISWITLSGGFDQLPQCHTIGQQAETVVQIACGLLSILSAVTCFYWQRWRRFVRTAWTIVLATTAGMSSFVWGPPMLTVGLALAALALLVALAIIWLMRTGGA
jgi:hypothetical protein